MNHTDQAAQIARIPLFSGLPEAELIHLANTLQPQEFLPGMVLIHEGEQDEHCYILLEGEVEVIKALSTPDERQLAVRQSGSLFGEMSLFDPSGCHTASCRALTRVQTLEMTRQDFDRLLQRYPSLAYDMVRQMSRRLEDTENATIVDLREKNRQLTAAYRDLQAAQEQLVTKERLEKELAIARQIQESILPEVTPQLDGFDIAAMTLPAREVGGDYYDFIPINRHRFGLVIGDACDKGIPAALFINLTNSLVRIEAKRNPSPEATLQLVNQHLNEMSRSGMFATMLYGILDVSGRFDYCRAGHPHPLVMDADRQIARTSSQVGMPLGVTEEIELDAQSVTIPIGGLMVLFSDGLSEAMDVQENQFGVERLALALPSLIDSPSNLICQQLSQVIKEYTGDQPQFDDFTVIVIKHTGVSK